MVKKWYRKLKKFCDSRLVLNTCTQSLECLRDVIEIFIMKVQSKMTTASSNNFIMTKTREKCKVLLSTMIYIHWKFQLSAFNNNQKMIGTTSPLNSFPLTLWVKAACLVLAIEVLLHARVLTLICACPIILATINFQMQIWDISKGF